jgi:hypothetical protein
LTLPQKKEEKKMKKMLAILGFVLLIGLNIQGNVHAENRLESSTMHFLQYKDWGNTVFSTAASAKQSTSTVVVGSPIQTGRFSDTQKNGGQAYIKVKLNTNSHYHSHSYYK